MSSCDFNKCLIIIFVSAMSQVEPKDKPIKPKRSKIMKDTRTNVKPEISTSERTWRSILVSDTCVQITAWSLLTVGLCIIASTIYMGILQRNIYINYNDNTNDYNDSTNYEYPIVVTTMSSELTVTVMLNKSVRSLSLSSANVNYNKGCQEYNCKVTCTHSDSLQDVIPINRARTYCPTIDVLLIKEQIFSNGLLHNSWINLNRSVYELELSNSNVTKIACGAFNSLPFTYTYQLSLRDLQLERLGGGVLLGLQSLRYLLIDTPLREINRAFLQPVQSTLLHLSINSGLVVLPGQTMFGVSKLEKLEYADLSDNVFMGPLTRQMLRAAPNLRYLHICNSHITAIDIDTFDDFTDVLQVLDLSGNLLTTISDSTLQPLLMGSSRTLISLSYNRWNCECDLQGFANIYRIFRKQFIDTIYCHSPYGHYGELLEDLSLEDDDCVVSTTNIEEYSESSKISDSETTTFKATTITKQSSSKFTVGLSVTSEVTEDARTKTTTLKSTLKPRTTLPGTSSTETSMKVTTHKTSNNTSNELLSSAAGDAITRSSSEDLDIITLRCLYTPILSTSNVNRSQRDKRSIEITIQSPTSDTLPDNITELSATSEEKEFIDKNQTNPSNSQPIEVVATSKPENIAMANDTTPTYSQTNGSRQQHTSYMARYQFEMPTYTFNLTLLSNKSVKILINYYNNYQPVNMIWFNRQSETTNEKIESSASPYIDYHCESYQPPYLIANDLTENCTYTFCVLSKSQTISPFDCQPMYVPLTHRAADGTWISEDEKPFTIGIVCMVFALSTFLGAVIGYFGIRQYPELLEGSKNVLVVKSSEPESNYLKSMGSIGKPPLSRRSTRKLSPSRRETPPISLPPPPPFSVSTFDLERLSSVKSSSTCFEKSFNQPHLAVIDDQYELPKPFNSLIYEERCVSNTYAMSPCSPPPLPKRNPSITSTINTNRFTKTE